MEDSLTERTLLTAMATRQGLYAVQAEDAASARARVAERAPDLILLDIHLPDVDGLSLLSDLREELPFVPVVIVSSTTDPEIVDEALRLGAVNFLHKPVKLAEFQFVVNRINQVLTEQEDVQEVLASVTERSTDMDIPGDPKLLSNVVAYLGREVVHHYPGHAVPLPDIKLALYEALANAVEHGNLEIGYDGKDAALADTAGLPQLIAERLATPPYSERRVRISIIYRPDAVEYRVRDEGRGFDPSSFDMERALLNPESLHGRGLALIRHYMTDVSWHDNGREIRMTQTLPPSPRP